MTGTHNPRGGRPIGQNIRDICELVAHMEPCVRAQIYEGGLAISSKAIRTYLGRAEKHGFLVRDGELYRTAANWRAMAEKPKRSRAEPAPKESTQGVYTAGWIKTVAAPMTALQP